VRLEGFYLPLALPLAECFPCGAWREWMDERTVVPVPGRPPKIVIIPRYFFFCGWFGLALFVTHSSLISSVNLYWLCHTSSHPHQTATRPPRGVPVQNSVQLAESKSDSQDLGPKISRRVWLGSSQGGHVMSGVQVNRCINLSLRAEPKHVRIK